MANELQVSYPTGNTLYAVVGSSTGSVYASTTPEAPLTAHWGTYAVALTEADTTGIYRGTFPALPAGTYRVWVYQRLGGSPATSDPWVGQGPMEWDGTVEIRRGDVVRVNKVLVNGAGSPGNPWGP